MLHETIQLHLIFFWKTFFSHCYKTLWQCVKSQYLFAGRELNFEKVSADEYSSFGIAYDYMSVMHYGPRAFAKPGTVTIRPLVRKLQAKEINN